MEVNKNQAIYKYLPGAWATYQEDGRHYSVQVEAWNTKKVTGVYKPKIVKAILRQIENFESKGGDISEYNRSNIEELFEIYEPSKNEKIADIYCNINPKFFYCSSCGSTKEINYNIKQHLICENCKKIMNQLQFVYSCECGHTMGVRIPKDLIGKKVLYKPSNSINDKATYHFMYKDGANIKIREMFEKCPNCGIVLKPQNASDRKHFIPFSIKAVNLLNEKMGEFLKLGIKAQKTLVSNWLEYINDRELNNIINNPNQYLEEDNNEDIIRQYMEAANITREQAELLINVNKKNSSMVNIYELCNEIDKDIIENMDTNIELISSTILEYMTLLNSKRKITLDQAKENALKTENILEPTEIDKINKKAGIKNTQLSSDIEIINATFGYTRRVSDPENIREQVKNKGLKLKLKSFFEQGEYKIYSSNLNTEGILIELDRKKIVEWLIANGVISDEIDIENEMEIKKWFLNNVDISLINKFGEIEIDVSNKKTVITKYVYELIHTISHILIKSAGIYSGLDKDSISELIFANIPAIYIYATTIQGITLGALSGLFEQNYKNFIENAINEAKTCIFDPICYETQNARCVGCTYISDTSCTCFNHGLSRAYLYGGKIKINEQFYIEIKRGFWS